MSAFGDTSGFLAFLDAEDAGHPRAVLAMESLGNANETLFSTNYVLVETISLLHHRFGLGAVRRFCEDVLPVVTIQWVDLEIHNVAVSDVLSGGRRGPSLVDCTSFEVIRRLGIGTAVAFDRHFAERGYDLPDSLIE